MQDIISDARLHEEEYSSRPAGDSPREYATTPRYFTDANSLQNGVDENGRQVL